MSRSFLATALESYQFFIRIRLLSIISWVYNVNWPPKLTFRAFALRQSDWNARKVSFETLYIGQLTLSTQLIILNYPVLLSHQRSSTISLETYPPFYLRIASLPETRSPCLENLQWFLVDGCAPKQTGGTRSVQHSRNSPVSPRTNEPMVH